MTNILDAVDWTLAKEEFYEQKRQRYEDWVKANVPKSPDNDFIAPPKKIDWSRQGSPFQK